MMKRLIVVWMVLIFVFTLPSSVWEDPSAVSAQISQEIYLPVINKLEQPYSVVGPDGGTVECLAIDPQDSSRLYAGTWGNGIYTSDDAGLTWVQISEGLPVPFIYDIVVDPADSTHLLASVYREGVFESTDRGENWRRTAGWPEGAVVYAIEHHPLDSDIVFAGIRVPTIHNPPNDPVYPGYVFKSSDGGRNWVNRSNGLAFDYVYDLAIDPNDPDVMYAAMHTSGVYKSTDGAGTWEKKWDNLQGFDIRSVDVHPETSAVYIGHWDGQGVSYSNDGGDFWYKISSTVEEKLYVYELQFDPNHPDTLYLSTESGVYTTDNPFYASDFQIVAHEGGFVYDLALDVNGGVDTAGKTASMYTALPYHGVYKSVDTGVTFEASYAGIQANVVTAVVNNPISPAVLYMAVYGRGVWKSVDAGDNWTAVNTGLPTGYIHLLAARPGNPEVLFASTDGFGLYRTENGAGSWTAVNEGLTADSQPVMDFSEIAALPDAPHPDVLPWMDPVDVDALMIIPADQGEERAVNAVPEVLTLSFYPNNPLVMIAGTEGAGVKKSNDGGTTWIRTYLWSEYIYDSFIDISQPEYFFFVGVRNFGVEVSNIDRMWWYVRNNGFHYEADVYSLAMAYPEVYYAGTESGIYKTQNAGLTWWRVGLTGTKINTLFIDPARPYEILAATPDGLFRSYDSGSNWLQDHQLFNDQVLTIAQGYGEFRKFFGLSGGNLYRMEE